ncbi:AMP-dependent synthetase [Babesia caballi]|uniref:AMP-dependent synthetase n=1 Tax=Babesia caballi TaxID=5871 RepID=A0AAV4LXP2_BABCB|nr:AMP-dependent synthetase [Babesia caballi]
MTSNIKLINTVGHTLHSLLTPAESPDNTTDNNVNLLFIFRILLATQQPGHLHQRPQPKSQYSIPQALQGIIGSAYTIEAYETIAPLLIPNELLKSLGQLANKTTLTITQSTYNMLKLLTKPGINTFNFFKKLFDCFGEGSGTIITTTLPILPRHPQDPINRLLRVGRAVIREVYQGG